MWTTTWVPSWTRRSGSGGSLTGSGRRSGRWCLWSWDHKPWLGYSNSAYQELGVNLELSSEEGFYNYYATRYLLWANDAAKAALGRELTGEGPDVSSCFLMNLVFDQLGWTGDAWAQATTDIWREIPPCSPTWGRYVRERGFLTAELDQGGAGDFTGGT